MSPHFDDFDTSDRDTGDADRRSPSFGQRHGLKIFGGILATLFTMVIVAQVAC